VNTLLYQDLDGLVRAGLSGLIVYIAVVFLVRLAGKRATSQMNNFDWIVTVALGSIVGSTIVLKDLPLAEGLLAIVVLLGAQYTVTKASTYSSTISNLVYSEPTILFFRGEYIDSAMRKERITRQEVLSAIRESGIIQVEDVGAVVLETDAKLSVLPNTNSTIKKESETTLGKIHNFQDLTPAN